PLVLVVLGGRDDGEHGDLAPGQELGRDRERVPGLPGARRRDQQEVSPRAPEVLVIGVFLPATKIKNQIIPNEPWFTFAGRRLRIRGAHEGEMLPGPSPRCTTRRAGALRRLRR